MYQRGRRCFQAGYELSVYNQLDLLQMENPVVREEEEEEEKEEVADERDRVQREWPATWSGEYVSEQQLRMYH